MDLIDAAKNGLLETVLNILESGFGANVRDKDDATALYWSACHGHDDVTEVLISAGCDVNAPVRWGSTALHAAADRGHLKCVQTLIDSGANPDSINSRGDSPLHIAAYRGFMDITRALLVARSNVKLTNEKGKTPKQEALEGGNTDVAECIRMFESEGRLSSNILYYHDQSAPRSDITGDTIYCSPLSQNIPVTNLPFHEPFMNNHKPVMNKGWHQSISTESSDCNESVLSSMSTSDASFPEDCVDSAVLPFTQQQQQPRQQQRNIQLRRSISFGGTHLNNRNVPSVGIAPRTPSFENIPVQEHVQHNTHPAVQKHFLSEPIREPIGRLRIRDHNACPVNNINTRLTYKSRTIPSTREGLSNKGQCPPESVDQSNLLVNNIAQCEQDIVMRHAGTGRLNTVKPVRSSVGSVVDIMHQDKDTMIHALQNQLVDSYKQIETLTKENEHLKFKSSTLLDRLNEMESKLSAITLKCDTLTDLLENKNKSVNVEECDEGSSGEYSDGSPDCFKHLIRRFEDMPNELESRLRETLNYTFSEMSTTESHLDVSREWLPGTDYVILGDPPIQGSDDGKLANFVSFLIRHLKTNLCYILKMKITFDTDKFNTHPVMASQSYEGHDTNIYRSQPNIIKVIHQFESSTDRLKKFVHMPALRETNLPQRELARTTTFLVTPRLTSLREFLITCENESRDTTSRDHEITATFWMYVLYQLVSVLCILDEKEVDLGDIDDASIGFDVDLIPYFTNIENRVDLQRIIENIRACFSVGSDEIANSTRKSVTNNISNNVSRLCSLFYNILFPSKMGYGPVFPACRHREELPVSRMEHSLRHILSDAIPSTSSLFKVNNTAKSLANRVGFLLFGPNSDKIHNDKDCRLYCQTRMLELLSQARTQKRCRAQGGHVTMADSVKNNQSRLEAHFLCHVTPQDILPLSRRFEQSGLSFR